MRSSSGGRAQPLRFKQPSSPHIYVHAVLVSDEDGRVRSSWLNRLSPNTRNCANVTAEWNLSKNAANDEASKPQYAGQVVVYFRKFQYVDTENGCALGASTTAFSSLESSYMAMGAGIGSPADFAHELGHYLGLVHAFGRRPADASPSRAEAPFRISSASGMR